MGGGAFALSFDGTNDLASRAAIPGTASAQTIELWVRPATNAQNSILIASADDVVGWSLELNGGQVTWWVSNTAGQWAFARHTGVTLAANTWYHVAVTYSAGSARIFVDGTPNTAATSVGTLTQGPQFRIGGLTGYPFFNGQLDEVRLSTVVRYSAAFTRPTAAFTLDASTQALYRFNEGSGQNVADSSSNAYNLTLGASSAVASDDPAWVAASAPITP